MGRDVLGRGRRPEEVPRLTPVLGVEESRKVVSTATSSTPAFARARSSVSVTSDAFIVVPSVHARM